MSISAVAWALKQDDLPSIHKFVLIVLANYSSQDGECFPSQSLVAKNCCITRPYVNKIIGDLEERGYLNVISRQRENGSDRSCAYELNLPSETPEKPNKDQIGFLYVIETTTKIKVGITRNLDSRIRGISTGMGENISLVRSYKMPMRVARGLEKKIHNLLQEFRLKGEWFSCVSRDVLPTIDSVVSTTLTPPVSDVDTPLSTSNTPPVNVADTYTEPSPNHQKEPSKKDNWPSDHAEQFWQRYPSKVGKAAAVKALEKIRKSRAVDWESLISAIDRYTIWLKNPKEWRPRPKHPATWLNAGCWDDELNSGEFSNEATRNAENRNGGTINGTNDSARRSRGQTRDDAIIAGMGRIADRLVRNRDDRPNDKLLLDVRTAENDGERAEPNRIPDRLL